LSKGRIPFLSLSIVSKASAAFLTSGVLAISSPCVSALSKLESTSPIVNLETCADGSEDISTSLLAIEMLVDPLGLKLKPDETPASRAGAGDDEAPPLEKENPHELIAPPPNEKPLAPIDEPELS
jgi:hypothetical protein